MFLTDIDDKKTRIVCSRNKNALKQASLLIHEKPNKHSCRKCNQKIKIVRNNLEAVKEATANMNL